MDLHNTPYSWSPVRLFDGELKNTEFESDTRYIGLELELEFNDYEFRISEDDEDNPNNQEEIQVYSEDYNDYFWIANPNYDPDSGWGDVNYMIDEYYEDGYKFTSITDDGSLSEHGAEIILNPVEMSQWDDVVNSHYFDFIERLWRERDKYDTQGSCGVHISVTEKDDTEIKRIEYILFRLGESLAEYTRDTYYAKWFQTSYGSELDFLSALYSNRRPLNTQFTYGCVRSNENRHEFRFFAVPDNDLRSELIQYVNLLKQIIDLVDNYSLMDLILSDMVVNSYLEISFELHKREFNLGTLSSDLILEFSV